MAVIERIKSEVAYLRGALRALRRTISIAKNPDRTFPDVVEDLGRRYGDRPALISDRETLSYRDYNGRANRYARWALAHGIQKGDSVALIMPNRPEYLVIWLGIIRIGGVVALVNTNLTAGSLAHSINLVRPRHIIVAADLEEAFETAEDQISGSPKVWLHGHGRTDRDRIDVAVEDHSPEPLAAHERVKLHTNDQALYVYTSGTTGLPKAANINHYRIQSIANGFSGAMAATAQDRMYVCLPLYHTTGGVLAAGTVLTVGGSVVIRERFSAQQFWDDVVGYECTLFQYVGELCRYLLNGPTHPLETKHKVRLCCGNGLRPDIWTAFKTRFRIPQILEFYGATEGNAVLFNFDGKAGSIGRVPKWLEKRFIMDVVQFDVDRERVERGSDGLCRRSAPNEPGELISLIVNDPSKPSQRFEGYTDQMATDAKILKDVFEKGDVWFRTGDLVRKDELGYYYFVDRIGDTFRWKGENVATSEVAEVITTFPGVKEAVVYGVRVEGREGRAGMATIVVDDDIGFDLAALKRHLRQQLPIYARPLFLRVTAAIEATGTFKQRKVNLVKDAFDPERNSDPIFFGAADTDDFVPIDDALYRRIQSGEIRL
ncbi:MAG TPA: long-chain-acyl-CoA synthetase [Kaistiaceae bacterium]|nr:long-chain-acyl-CoA synthetase [Kaistiaceae bacterium]